MFVGKIGLLPVPQAYPFQEEATLFAKKLEDCNSQMQILTPIGYSCSGHFFNKKEAFLEESRPRVGSRLLKSR